VIGITVLLAGCSSSTAPTLSASHLAVLPVPSTSGPRVCHQIAANLALRQLPTAISRLEIPSEQTVGRQVVGASASELRSLAAGSPKTLAASLEAAADALTPLATAAPNQSAINKATSALERLATNSQSICSFSTP
jgi:hypothetical protein